MNVTAPQLRNLLLGPEDDPNQETTSFFDELQSYEASKTPPRNTCLVDL